MPTLKELQSLAREKGCTYSGMKKADLEKHLKKCTPKSSSKTRPKASSSKSDSCFESESSAVACFSRLVDQYPTLKSQCACPSEVRSLQESAGATVLLTSKDKIVGVVNEEGVMRKVSPPMKAPPGPPPLPTFKATKKLESALDDTKPLSSSERQQVRNVSDVGGLLADIQKGKKLRKVTPKEKQAIKKGGLEDAISRAMNDRRRAIQGDDEF